MSVSTKQAMWLAFQEARKGEGWVEPNPPVGCVILDSDCKLLSSGYHEKYGGDHAEVCALKKIKNKNKLQGAHVFVTLEPCHHTGKTPSCALELAQYPIQSLTYGVEDPFTKKKGLDHLREKGINIIRSPDFQEEMESLVEIFKFASIHKKPFVSLKVASSLDGVIALASGESHWITGEKAREHSHFLRATHSAVLIGVNTFLQDNPQCNIRIDRFKKKKNKVIILDPHGKSFQFLPQSRLLKMHSPDRVIVCCSDQVKTDASALGVKVKFFTKDCFKEDNFKDKKLKTKQKFFAEEKQLNKKPYFCLASVLKNLYQEEQIQSVLVEGGAYCWSQFLQEQIAQKLYLYIAPRIIGMGIHWSKYFTVQSLYQSITLDSVKLTPSGDDFLLEGSFT